MNVQKQRDFLISVAYWAVISGAVYLAFEYLLPISVPFILGILIARLVIGISHLFRTQNKVFRLCTVAVIYGLVGLLVALLVSKGVSGILGLIQWLPQVYERKLLPFATICYEAVMDVLQHLNPTVLSAIKVALEGMVSSLKDVVTSLSGFAVSMISNLATGIPSLILSMLAMIFSTVFLVIDYEKITAFASEYTPLGMKKILKKIKFYLTDTLFVVIRSYAIIMFLTFTELSIMFSIFGIQNPVLKASIIALLDILPILGTGGIMIPWAVISLAVGYTKLGIELFIIYAIVTVVRNYVEPKIVGTQLGLHPIISLISMFIGLRLFGFWGLFGLPVGISFLWKEKKEKDAQLAAE